MDIQLPSSVFQLLPLGEWSLRMMIAVAAPSAWAEGGAGGLEVASGAAGSHNGLLNAPPQQVLLIPHTAHFTAGCGLPSGPLSWGGVWAAAGGGVALGSLPLLLHSDLGSVSNAHPEQAVLPQLPVLAVGGLLLRDASGRPASLFDCVARFSVSAQVTAAALAGGVRCSGMRTFPSR